MRVAYVAHATRQYSPHVSRMWWPIFRIFPLLENFKLWFLEAHLTELYFCVLGFRYCPEITACSQRSMCSALYALILIDYSWNNQVSPGPELEQGPHPHSDDQS